MDRVQFLKMISAYSETKSKRLKARKRCDENTNFKLEKLLDFEDEIDENCLSGDTVTTRLCLDNLSRSMTETRELGTSLGSDCCKY